MKRDIVQLTKGIADLNEILQETEELRILYVYDDLWGKGSYKVKAEDKEIDHISKTLEEYKDEKGVTVFTCKHITQAFQIIELLIKIDYCVCIRFTSIEEIKVYDDILFYISFGTETG